MVENWTGLYRYECHSWERTLSLWEHSSQTFIWPFYETAVHLMVVKCVMNELTGRVDAGHSVWGQWELFITVAHRALRGLVAISWLAVTAVLHWVDNNFTVAFHAWKWHYHIILMGWWSAVGKLEGLYSEVCWLEPYREWVHHCALKQPGGLSL